jgi:hypothetical protein
MRVIDPAEQEPQLLETLAVPPDELATARQAFDRGTGSASCGTKVI